MFDSLPWALALLLTAMAARAQVAVARDSRQRSVTVPGDTTEPLPWVHVASGVRTVLLFDSPIQENSLEWDQAHIRLVQAGAWALVLEPLSTPAPGEHSTLRVAWADVKNPGVAEFALTSHVSEVDTLLNVRRWERPASDPGCQTEPARSGSGDEARGVLDFARSGSLEESGISTARLQLRQDTRSNLDFESGLIHRGKGWVLVKVILRNRVNRPPWTPRTATLTSTRGQHVTVRAMTSEPREIAPEEKGTLFMETELPAQEAGREFVLEVRGADGRTFTHSAVKLPPPAQVLEP